MSNYLGHPAGVGTTIYPSTNIIQTPLINGLPMANQTVSWPPEPVAKRAFKPTPFLKAVIEAQNHSSNSPIETKSGFPFRVLSGNDAINVFGKLRPMYCGRPQKWAEMLLRAGPSPVQSYSKTATHHYYQAASAGLFMVFPAVIGAKRTRFRLTSAALVLLDFYAERNPKFLAFLKAYLPQKARDEINLWTCDLIMGVEPKFVKAEKEKAAAAQAKQDLEKAIADQANAYKLMQLASQSSTTGPSSSAAQLYWAHTQHTAASSAYANSVNTQTLGQQYQDAIALQAHMQGMSSTLGQWQAVKAAAKRAFNK